MASNNLNKFKPGNTAAAGNTGPRGLRISRMCTQTLISILNEPGKVAQFETDRKKKLYEVGDALVNAARGGDVVAIKYIFDRIDGTPTQMIGEDPASPMKRPVFIVKAAAVSGENGASAGVTIQVGTEDDIPEVEEDGGE